MKENKLKRMKENKLCFITLLFFIFRDSLINESDVREFIQQTYPDKECLIMASCKLYSRSREHKNVAWPLKGLVNLMKI